MLQLDIAAAAVLLIAHVLLDAQRILVLLAKFWHRIDHRQLIRQDDLQVVLRGLPLFAHELGECPFQHTDLMERRELTEIRLDAAILSDRSHDDALMLLRLIEGIPHEAAAVLHPFRLLLRPLVPVQMSERCIVVGIEDTVRDPVIASDRERPLRLGRRPACGKDMGECHLPHRRIGQGRKKDL